MLWQMESVWSEVKSLDVPRLMEQYAPMMHSTTKPTRSRKTWLLMADRGGLPKWTKKTRGDRY